MTISPPTTEAEAALAAELTEVPARAAGVLTVDLAAIAENYARLKAAMRQRAVGAVVKADGYGLGAERVAPALVKAGARSIFVAQLDEALKLRPLLDRCHPAAKAPRSLSEKESATRSAGSCARSVGVSVSSSPWLSRKTTCIPA